jgi:hypothetical protein
MKKKNKQSYNIDNETDKYKSDNNHRYPSGKKFSHFLFEFLMVFLAITGGYFANNLRENMIDRNREKEYIAGLIHDIEIDTASVKEIIAKKVNMIKGLDSLILYLENPIPKSEEIKFYIYCTRYLNSYQNFTARDITISQLQNVGSLRLVKSKEILDSIVMYYSNIDSYDNQTKFAILSFQQIMEIEIEHFDFKKLKSGKDLVLPSSKVLSLFYNRIVLMQVLLKTDLAWSNSVYDEGKALIEFLEKEYNMEGTLAEPLVKINGN